MKIVTGYRGEPHITSQDHQSFYQGVFGREMYVLGTGNEFAATLTDTNTITVSDGDGIMQGCHFRIDLGEEEEIVMPPGSSGMYRNDLLVARYTKDAETAIEDVQLVSITGTPTEGRPDLPSYHSGEIVNGETVDFPLYRVHFSGFTIDEIVPLFFILPSFEAVYQSHEALADNVDQGFAAVNTSITQKYNTLNNSINQLLTWKFLKSANGTASVTFPLSTTHEIAVVTKISVLNGHPVYASKIIPVVFIDSGGVDCLFVTRWGSEYNGDVVWMAKKTSSSVIVYLYVAYNGTTNATSGATTWYYYRGSVK